MTPKIQLEKDLQEAPTKKPRRNLTQPAASLETPASPINTALSDAHCDIQAAMTKAGA